MASSEGCIDFALARSSPEPPRGGRRPLFCAWKPAKTRLSFVSAERCTCVVGWVAVAIHILAGAVVVDPAILVVDDNEDNRVTLRMRLEICGYTNIIEATNGREALEKMRAGPIDIVLLDIMMPGLDGYGVLREMKTDIDLRLIPVVMVSAAEEISSVVRCIE